MTSRGLWPSTLVGRTILVMVASVILSQVASVVVFSHNRFELESRLFGSRAADHIAAAVKITESTPQSERTQLLRAIEVPGLHVGWGAKPLAPQSDAIGEASDVVTALSRRLDGYEVHATVGGPPDDPNQQLPPPGSGVLRALIAHGPHPLLRVAVKLNDGTWLNFLSPTRPPEPLWRPGFYAPLFMGIVLAILLSAAAVAYAARPLRTLAEAAQRLGRDVGAPPVPETGPREVRDAAVAFNEMQTRLRRFIDDRTQMTAAISHDLRTPITRMRLRAEFVEDDEQRAKMLTDLDEMEAMIASTLAFARDDAARELRSSVDVAAMLAGLAADFGAVYAGPDRLMLEAGPMGLKRAFANLLENAQAYAGDAHVTLSETSSGALILVEDNGPGIPPSELERVFAPFYRLERSRNRETGGTGLGLAVARSAIRSHGGDIVLSNRPDGGLRASVTLPV
ncbi:MAG TPA: ATP-binding protein [Magnetospirillaceae bacterium]